MTVQMASGETFAGYRIEAVAGEGPMGVVYRALQTSLARTVALKVVDPDVPDDVRERFAAAARVLASIEHPHVIGIWEAGQADGRLFIAMRWVEGTDLGALLDSSGPLEAARAARIVAQVGEALDAAHARGLAHGDVKPSNILIEERDGSDHAFLTDFGAGEGDAQSDIAALRGVLVRALSGAGEPTTLWARPGVPVELADVTRAESYDSAGALGHAAVAAASVRQAPEPEVVESPKRRRPIVLGALVAGALVVAAGVIALLISGGDEPRGTTHGQTTGRLPARGEPKVEHVRLGPKTAPGDVAVDARNVYVTDRRTGDLLFVDKAARKIVHRLSLPDVDYVKPDLYKANRLWASFPDRHLVLQIDTRRGRIVGPRIHVPGEPTLLAATRDSVVVATEPQKHLLLRRFDKTTGRRVSGVVRSKGTPTDVDSAADQIAVVNWIQPAVLTYGPRLEQGKEIDVKLPQGTSLLGQAGTELAVGADDVAWLLLDDARPDSFAVVRVSLRTHQQIGKMIPLGRGLARDIAVDHGSVWVPNAKGDTVVRIDERSGRVVGGPINVGEIGGDVAAMDGEAWVGGARDLIRITP